MPARAWALCLLLAATAARAYGADDGDKDAPFDPDQYPEAAMDELVAKSPCARNQPGLELKDVMFSSQVGYGESMRGTSEKRLKLIKTWAKSLNAEGQAALYDRELKMRDGKKVLWMPFPSTLLQYMRRDLRSGDTAWFYMTYVGCVDGEPLFAIEDFSPPTYEDLEQEASSYVT